MDEEREFNSSLRLIAKSSVVVFIALALSKIFTYVYRIIIARQFGPEAYGLFALALMVSGWIIILGIFGLNDGLLRYISIFRGKKDQKKINYVFRKSFYLLLITGVIGGVLLFAFSGFLANIVFKEPQLEIFLKLFSLTIPFSTVLVAFMSSLRAYEKIGWRVFLSSILTTFLHATLILIFIAAGMGLIAIPLSYVAGVFIVFITAVVIVKKKIPGISLKKSEIPKGSVFSEVLSYSWPLIFAEIIWKIFKWTDSFFIGYFQTAAEVGFYNAALPIALLVTFSADLFAQMFVPLINKEYSKNNKEVVKQLTQQVGKWIFFTSLPILILLFLFPAEFLNLLFGNEFVVASTALQILLVGIIFLSFGGIGTRILGMLGKSKRVLFNIVLAATINLFLNIILIPKYGIVGAAFSTSFSFIILSLMIMGQVYLETKIIPIRRKNLNIFMAAVFSLALLLLVKPLIEINNVSLIVLSVFFLLFYTLLVLIFKGFDKNDVMIFKSFAGKINKKK